MIFSALRAFRRAPLGRNLWKEKGACEKGRISAKEAALMSEAVAVSDDALKLLVAEHGVRGTARLLGMDDRQMEAFKRRVTRQKWMEEPGIAAMRERGQIATPGRPLIPVVPKMSPTAALASEIAALGSKTKLSLARGMAKAGEHIETLDGASVVAQSQDIKAIAQTADLVHGWKDAPGAVKIRLDVLSGSSEAPTIDIQADVSTTELPDYTSDPLDDY